MKILWLVGVVLIGFGVKALLDYRAIQSSSVKVTAEVIGETAPTKENRVPRAGRVELRYEYLGQIFRVSNTAHDKFWAALKPGDKVDVILNEKKPTHFMAAEQAAKGGHLGRVLIAAGAVVLVLSRVKF